MNDYEARSGNGAGGAVGSVKRARERMEAGLPPDIPRARGGLEQRSNAPSPPNLNRRPVQQEATGSSIGENAIGVAISRPMPASQWPLMDAVSDPAYRPPPGRAVAPQRPPRPSRVPSILDSSQPQEHVPAFAYNSQVQRKPPPTPQYPDEDLFSPEYNNPRTPETPSAASASGSSSRPSTQSSVGTIPDFPLPTLAPTLAQAGRRSANIGPPPISRRGASSYYSSHASYVSPIPEESPRMPRTPRTPRTQRSHTSYASSAAIPSSWGSASQGYYYDGEISPGMDGGIMSEHGIIEEGRESRESNYDGNEEQGLVRQASVGKRGKPALIDTKSTENMNSITRALPQSIDDRPTFWGLRESVTPETAVAAAVTAGFASGREAGTRETVWPTGNEPNPPTIPNIPPDSRAYDPNLSSANTDPLTASSEAIPIVGRAISSSERMSYRRSLRQPIPQVPGRSDARVSRILGAHEAASAINPSAQPLFSRLSAIRRPPRLDIDAVRTAEARGSLTSLPDLIRRATRLAAMMDKGKRPASRFEWSMSPGGKSVVGMEREPEPMDFNLMNEKRQTGGIGEMIAAFPAPGLATPTREVGPRPDSMSQTASPTPYLNDKSSFDEGKEPRNDKKQRRCCGLPLCGFLILVLAVLLVVIAAIVVPIELFVVRKAKPKTSTALTLQSCIAQTTCLNGGKNDISSGVCSCICVNGFTGATCASDTNTVACTTADITGATSVSNVTLGSALPRLIASAESNFTIPLLTNVILAKLNTASLSCVGQNSLVTFNGVSGGTVTSSGLTAAALKQKGVIFSTSVTGSVEITLTVPGGSGTDTINLTGDSTLVTIDLRGTQGAAAAAVTSTSSSVTIDLEGSSTLPGIQSTTMQTTTSTSAPTTTPTTTPTTAPTTATTPSTSSSETPSASFVASQEMLDFSRVAVLYVLQQEDITKASTAQTAIQSFLTSASSTNAAAQNFTIGNGNTIDLVNFAVDVGNGTVGSLKSTASTRMKIRDISHYSPYQAF